MDAPIISAMPYNGKLKGKRLEKRRQFLPMTL